MKRSNTRPGKRVKDSKAKKERLGLLPPGVSEAEWQVFNDPELTGTATELTLRRARAGRFFISDPDDAIALHYYGKINLPWVSTDEKPSPFEALLMKIKLDPERATVFPTKGLEDADVEARHTEFWNYIYGTVVQIGKLFRFGTPEEVKAREAEFKRRQSVRRKYGFSEEHQRLPSLPASKRATIFRRVAGQLAKQAAKINPWFPALANSWRLQAKLLSREATQMIRLAKLFKKHSVHAETWRILELMNLVHHETGDWHDTELSEMLSLVGLFQMAPDDLRVMRARFNKKTRIELNS